ncbi:MAG: hypothetical protein ACYC63_04800 [Armatimonadota bacterium]
MALDLTHISEISKAIRGLCLGRVYLKADAAMTDTILQVGVNDEAYPGLCIPGAQSFHGATSLAVRVVQPRVAPLAGNAGIQYAEEMTAVAPDGNPLHLTLTAPLENTYTVARNAYVELVNRPAVSLGLKTVIRDFAEADEAPEDKYFPGIFVAWDGESLPSNAVGTYNETLDFMIRYGVVEQDGIDNRAVCVAGAEQLVNMLMEDNYLGGTAHESTVTGLTPSWSTRGKMMNRGGVFTQGERRVIWIDILLEASRVVVWDKISSVS